jgi:TetR/AcrR family transcriptional repressor of mexJK operon
VQLAIDFCSLLQSDFHNKLLCGVQEAMLNEAIGAHVEIAVEKTLLLFNTYCTNKDE